MKTTLYITLLICLSFSPPHPCPTKGDSRNLNIQALDVLKNRNTKPTGADIVQSITIHSLLNSHDDVSAFDQHKAAAIEGYLFDAKQEHGESCNCHSTNSGKWDIHMYLAPTKNAAGMKDCVIIEITPYSRSLHPQWTLSYLRSLVGKKIKVTGWLMYDFEHKNVSYETNPHATHLYRHTVWEIHPITSIDVLDN